ncbi:MAG: efflux transporter outer membrane subunit, partial [Verrucomicrobia bacterium]|nr:efflux transporter outer membrane subunit [Verrucomicrobiota bacterium]
GWWVLVILAFGGCALGPDYKRPDVASPSAYRFESGAGTNSFGDLGWREVFPDPLLQGLISAALTNNYDLQQAVARVEQARNLAVAARAPLMPAVGYGGNVGRGRNSVLNSPVPTEGLTESSASATLGATWEIDVWGRIRRLSQAARAQYLATDEARRAVTISLVGQVSTAYFQLMQYDRELQIQRDATNAYMGSYRIFDQRRINGVASKLETDRALAAFANAAAAIPTLELSVALTENQLSVLLGQAPGPVNRRTLDETANWPMDIPAGLPSALLQRRPDVAASEQSLIAANANIGANLAAMFPQFGLTAFLGKVSPELSAFTGGSANAWNLGATLAGPLFQGGALRAQYRAAKAQFQESLASYQQTVLTALQDVSNALISREKYAVARSANQDAVVALTSSVDLATQRYLNGKSSYYEVLQAQQELYPSQRAEVQARVNERLSVIQLYVALGGGWTNTAPAIAP